MSEDLTTLDIGFGPGKWGNWNWGTVQSVGVQNGSDRTFVSVQAAFAFLLLFGVLVLSIWILVLNRSRKVALKPMPIITTLVAMFFMVA